MKILYYLPDINNPFWAEITQAVKKQANTSNYTLNAISAEENSDLQVAQLNDYKIENPDGIIISSINVDKIAAICKEIMQSGIPVVSIDQHMAGSVHSSVISGNLTGGISAAQYIDAHLNVRGAIVHVQAPQGYENADIRRRGFLNEIERKNGNIVRTLYGEWSAEISKSQMLQFLEEKIEFNAVFAENDIMALGVTDALKQVNYSPWPIIVGFDGIPEAIESIRRKEMSATIQQNPDKMGQKAVEIIGKIKDGIPFDEVVNVSTHLISVDTI